MRGGLRRRNINAERGVHLKTECTGRTGPESEVRGNARGHQTLGGGGHRWEAGPIEDVI